MTQSQAGWIDDFASSLASSFLPVRVDLQAQLPIHPLRTVQTLDAEELLTVLNFKDESREGLMWRLNRISDRLRRWVDEWLDSGRGADGVECPANRNYEMARAVVAAIYKYSTRGKMHLLGTSDGLVLWFDLQEEKTPPASKGLPLEVYIETVASEKLVLLLNSDLSYKLAKCREPECGQYFVLKHWNRTYRGGTLCSSCQRARSLRSAAEATEDERDDALRQLHILAAKKFKGRILKSPEWHKDPALRNRIAQYLSEQIENSKSLTKIYPDGVTGRWVARRTNWEKIESTAKKEGANHVSVSL